MSDLLGIGASGIRAYGRALSTVSDNIANAQTPGYARRATRLEEARGGGDPVFYRGTIHPGGVSVAGVDRAVNMWLIEDARVGASDAGRAAAKLQWLEAAEAALDDGPNGVGATMTALFNSADLLASDPSSTARRSAFLGAVDGTATAFRRAAAGLASTAAHVAQDADGAVGQLNTDLDALSRVNDGLNRAREGSSNQATLLDERDRLVDQIAVTLPIAADYDARGAVSLRTGGDTLLDGATIAQIAAVIGTDGRIGFNGIAPPQSGTLAGLADAANQIAGRRTSLNGLASQFAAGLNTAHEAGFDARGAPGKTLLSGTDAASIIANALVPADVAAADADSANGQMLALSALRGPGGGEAGWAALVTAQSSATAAARAQDAAAATRRDGASAARDAISAVDLDQEAAELLRFQQAYEGAARVIQVARETMQSVLNIF
jgi:flagellar hook-associated protein 1